MSIILWRNRLAVLFLWPLFGVPVFAQDVRVETQQQARTRQQNVPSEEEQPQEVADPELGEINLVSRQPRPKMFTFFTGQSLNFSSNPFLVRDDEQSDFYWSGRVAAVFVPYATRDFTPSLTFDQSWFRYHDFGVLDFNAQTLTMDVKYDLDHNDTWYVNGNYALSRFEAPHSSIDEFYRSGFLNASITHLIQFQSVPVGLSMTGGAYWRHGDPSISDRVAGYLNFLAIYNLAEKVQLSAFARPEVQHYTHDPAGSRDDFNVTIGAAVSWNPKDYLSVSASAYYVGNFSTIDEHRYDVVNPSLTFAAKIDF
jgi:hypothetical protein